MEISELAKALKDDNKLTSIQLAVKCESFIGKEVEIKYIIDDIKESEIILSNYKWPGGSMEGDLSYSISYDSKRLGSELMKIAKYDKVKMICKISYCEFYQPITDGNKYCICGFELLSISKI